MGRAFLKLRLILWKNFIIRKRHWILTTLEIAVPIILGIVTLYLSSIFPQPETSKTEYNYVENITYMGYNNTNIYFAPNHPKIQELMDNLNKTFQPIEYIGFETETELLSYIQMKVQNEDDDNYDTKYRTKAIVFDDFPENEVPKNLKYRIRPFAKSKFMDLFPDFALGSPSSTYYTFLRLQYALDMSYIEMVTNSDLTPYIVTLQQVPNPAHVSDLFSTISKFLYPILTLIAFQLLFLTALKKVLQEKSTGIKELMKMMGLKSWMCWLGWFIFSMAINIITVTIITLLFVYGLGSDLPAIITKGNPFILWIFLLLYCISLLSLAYFISTIFKKPTLGTSVGLIVYIFLTVVGYTVIPDDSTSNKPLEFLFMLLPSICLRQGFNAIVEFEKYNGIGFDNMWTIPDKYLPHSSMAQVLLTLIGDTLLYGILTWYIENIFPGEYGVGRPWNFLFTKSYWVNNKVRDENSSISSIEEREDIEKESSDMKEGIQIRNLHKSFSGNEVVKGLNLNIYQNNITVLLGHNGAGKTTTMNMITGMTSPSAGTIVVNGYNISNNMDTVRKSLGLCPQFDVQFTDLTVLEHLMFFAMLRGYDKQKATVESQQMLNLLHLSAKENCLAGQLSGGMRRKLSLAMAVVGASDILILDEPTSGLDPEARREIWDFLLSMRGTRTILITTHYMEEADILGDRIAIMHDGSLKCYGSPLFLKKHYGTGYILSILVSNEWNLDKITQAVLKYIVSAKVKNINGNCITYTLPTSNTTALSMLFINLENIKGQLNISNFGVSVTTMEDVFLRVGEIADDLDKDIKHTNETNYFQNDHYATNNETIKSKSTLILKKLKVKGLFLKRFYYIKHNWINFLFQILIPLVITILTLILTMIEKDNTTIDDPKINLELNKYGQTNVFYSYSPNNNITENLANIYDNLAQKQQATVTSVGQVSNAIIELGIKNFGEFERSLIVSAEFNETRDSITLNGMFGNLANHGPPISLNLITNTILKFINNDQQDSYSISVTLNPLPDQDDEVFSKAFDTYSKAFTWMFLIPLGFTLMIGLLITFPQEERSTGVMHSQIMSGVSKTMYWIVNFLIDISVYILMSIVMVILLFIFDTESVFTSTSSIGALFSILILFGFAALPFVYILTFRKSAAGNMTILILTHIIIGLIGALAIIILIIIPLPEDDTFKRDIAMYALYIFPNFAFCFGMFIFTKHSVDINTWKISDEKEKLDLCRQKHPCCTKLSIDENSNKCLDYLSYFGDGDDTSLKTQVIFMAAHFFVYSAILLFLETGIPRKYFEKLKDYIFKTNFVEETLNEDVIEEKYRIEEQIKNNAVSDVLIAKNLKKWYSKNIFAARDLNFGVKSGECFGLLGVNGAGKTTTFKMLTGDIPPSDGESYINELSLQKNRSEYLKNIGYCPQFNALNFGLTGREMLTCFAYLRGVQEDQINTEVDRWLYRCGIKQYEDKICKTYSGGNKRKLSTAVALIGNPSLIMLDEPTCGVDPVARRKLWDVLNSIRKIGQSIVLTTHSMEECEALCDRLGIMVDGQFRCIGNIQTLKSKFGQGFTVIIKLRQYSDIFNSDTLLQLKETLNRKFSCTLKDEHMGMLQYHINPINTSIGHIFSFMEALKNSNKFIEDYTVNDTSLEEVFLSFAKTKMPLT